MGLFNFLKLKFTQRKAIKSASTSQNIEHKSMQPSIASQKVNYQSMPIYQIMEYIGSGKELTASIGTSFTRRLFELTYFDINTSDEEQHIAEVILSSLIKDMESGLANSTIALQAYRDLNELMYKEIPKTGRGSLAWKLQLAVARGVNCLNLLIDPASGPLYPSYIEFIGEEWKNQKHDILKALICDRRRSGEYNATIILSALVCANDPVAWNILLPMERISLMLTSRNYYKARSVLVNNDILPMQQKALPFEPRRDSDFMGSYLMLVLNDEKDDVNIEWRTALKEDLSQLSSMQQDFVEVSINVLRIRLTISMLQDIYGEEYAEIVKNTFISILKNSWDKFTGIYNLIEDTEARYLAEQSNNIGLDSAIAYGFYTIFTLILMTLMMVLNCLYGISWSKHLTLTVYIGCSILDI